MGKVLRWIGIILLGLTAAFTIMGGAGTTCVALAAENFDSMIEIAPYKWLYIIFVITTIAAGVMMVRATIMLVKRNPNAYRDTIVSLIAGIVIGFIHMMVSRNLRGSSMPVDAVTYTAVLTLLVFLIFKIPGVWEKVDYTQAKPGDNETAGGAAAITSGLLAFTIQYMMASTHTMNGGINYGDAFHTSMTIVGWGLVLGGSFLIWAAQFRAKQHTKNLVSKFRRVWIFHKQKTGWELFPARLLFMRKMSEYGLGHNRVANKPPVRWPLAAVTNGKWGSIHFPLKDTP